MNVNKVLFQFIKIAFSVMLALLVIYFSVQLCKNAYDYGYRVFTEPAVAESPGEDIMVQIKEGMSGKEIGEMLEEKGLVEDGQLFNVQLKLSAYKDRMKPGVYTLNTSMTAKEMMVTIANKAEQETQETQETETTTVEE